MKRLLAVLLAAVPLAAFAVYEGPIFDAHLRDHADYGTGHANPDIAQMIEDEHKRGYYRGGGEFRAHTGLWTPLARVDELLGKYPRLWGELSYRWDVWLGELAPEVAGRIAGANGARLFGLP